MRRILAAVLAIALVIPVATASAGPCGPDKAFGYRTTAGNAAARDILTDLGFGDQLAARRGISPGSVLGLATDDELVVLAGSGFFGDPVTSQYDVDFAAFSGIVGVSDDGIDFYAVQAVKVIATEPGSGTTDTSALYEKYLGAAWPTLSGTPCPAPTAP